MAAIKKKVAPKPIDLIHEQCEHVVDLAAQVAASVTKNQLSTAQGRLDKLILEFGRLVDMKKAKKT
jgi:hypothetical protein